MWMPFGVTMRRYDVEWPGKPPIRHYAKSDPPNPDAARITPFETIEAGWVKRPPQGISRSTPALPPSPPDLRGKPSIPKIGWVTLIGAVKAIVTVTGCRFPIGDPQEPDFRLCNARRVYGSPYCRVHKVLCILQDDT